MISVLYVDDEEPLLVVCKLFLEKTGDFCVDTTISPFEAQKKLKSTQYDAIVSDYQMPGMDGIAFLKSIRKEYLTLPFIIFTGKGREEVAIEAFENGADFYVQKGGEPKSQFAELKGKISAAVERRRAENALKESEEKYRNLVERANDGILVIQGGIIRYCNQYFAGLVGISIGEIEGKSIFEFQTPEDMAKLQDAYKRRMAGGAVPGIYETAIKKKDGSEVFVELNAAIIMFNGAPADFVIIRDITQRILMETELRRNEEKFRTIFDTAVNLIASINRQGIIVDCNQRVRDMLSYEKAEIIGKPIAQVIHPDYLSHPREIFAELLKTGSLSNRYFMLVKKDGSFIEVSINATGIKDRQGEYFRVVCIIDDITERKQAEEAINDSQAFLKDILDSIQDGISILDCNQRIVLVNRAMEQWYAHKMPLIGRTCYDAYYGASRPCTVCPTLRVLKTGEASQEIVPKNDADGNVIGWQNLFVFPMKDRDTGEVTRVIEYVRDITEQKTAEKKLLQSENRFRGLVEMSPDLIWELDANGNFTYLSPQCLERIGYSTADLIGKPVFAIIPEEHRSEVEALFFAHVAGTNTSRSFEVPAKHRDGHRLTVEIRVTPLLDENGQIRGFSGIALNITDRKRMEDALRQANKHLHLLSSITRHDILNQILVLKGYLDLLDEYQNDPVVHTDLIKKGQITASAIESQIALTREYQEMGVKEPVWQDVSTIIRQMSAILPTKNVRVEVEWQDPLVFADPLFERVIYNLIDNTLRYAGDQLTTIRFSSYESDGNTVLVCEDDGVGISDEDKKYLFERGFGKHTGLGLFLSREILAITGITIIENGIPGKGVRFEITVPKRVYRLRGQP